MIRKTFHISLTTISLNWKFKKKINKMKQTFPTFNAATQVHICKQWMDRRKTNLITNNWTDKSVLGVFRLPSFLRRLVKYFCFSARNLIIGINCCFLAATLTIICVDSHLTICQSHGPNIDFVLSSNWKICLLTHKTPSVAFPYLEWNI